LATAEDNVFPELPEELDPPEDDAATEESVARTDEVPEVEAAV